MNNKGVFVAKIFRGKDMSLLVAQLGSFFKSVTICKPRASRDSSIEAFVVCKDYCPSTIPSLSNPLLDFRNGEIAPFLSCGDLDFDADKTYSLPPDYDFKQVLAPPINPPYKTQLDKRKKLLN